MISRSADRPASTALFRNSLARPSSPASPPLSPASPVSSSDAHDITGQPNGRNFFPNLLRGLLEVSSKYSDEPFTRLDVRSKLPSGVSRFLGHRPEGQNQPIWALKWLHRYKVPLVVEDVMAAFFSTWLLVILICLVHSYSALSHLPIPIILSSAGAAAVILFVTPLAPAATPRSLILGQFWASLVSSIVTRILLGGTTMNSTVEHAEMSHNVVWLAACLSLSITIVLQISTKSVHPPGGATALLGSISPGLVHIGFKYIGVVMVMVSLLLGVAMVLGNVGRRKYPLYWFMPPVSKPAKPVDQSNFDPRIVGDMVSDAINIIQKSCVGHAAIRSLEEAMNELRKQGA